jgi:manganese/zinc/iron transport system ATP- binding protein
MENTVVEIKDLTVAYQNQFVLQNIQLSIPKGNLVGIIGPNGAGKSTLLNAIMQLTPKIKGDIKILGDNLSNVRKQIAFIPQRDSVDWNFPISVLDLVLMGRYSKSAWFKNTTLTDKNIALNCLEKVKMYDLANKHISELSGGEKQRVFIARALAQEAEVYFFDEPLVGIDATSEREIMEILTNLKNEGKSIFVVHHDLQSSIDYFDWVIFINRKIVASGPISEVFNLNNLQNTYGEAFSVLTKINQLVNNSPNSILNK